MEVGEKEGEKDRRREGGKQQADRQTDKEAAGNEMTQQVKHLLH